MSKQSDQRGLAHLAVVAIVVVLVGVIGFAGWRVASNKSTSGGTKPVANKQVESACLKELNDKNLCKFASSFSLNTSYKATITSISTDGTSTSYMSSDGKQNSTMTINQGGKEVTASVLLNGDSYIKDETTGTWIKYPKDTSSKPDNTNPTSDIKVDANDLTQKDTVTYKFIGKEKCGKLNCFKYQLVDKTAADSTQYIWFDDKDYQMQRWSSKDSNGSVDMSFTYTKVNITAPSPSKDFSLSNSADVKAAQDAAAAAAASLNAASTTDNSGDSTDSTSQ